MKIIVFFVTLILLITASGCKKDSVNTGDYFVPIDNLITHFPFNGNAKDSSSYKNKVNVVGVSLTEDKNGKPNSAYYFDGNSYVEIINSHIFDMSSNQLTISAWIKPSSSSMMYIVEKADMLLKDGTITQGGGPYCLDIFPGKARSVIQNNDARKPLWIEGKTAIKKDIWQHLAISWNGKNAYLYYNGQIDTTMAYEKPLIVTNGNIYIGMYKFTNLGFKGTMDNVRIYNRFLKPEEITDLYTNYK